MHNNYTEREEYEVTGEPDGGYPNYKFVFGNPNESNQNSTPKERAEGFINYIKNHGNWAHTIKVRRRVIREYEWEEASL